MNRGVLCLSLDRIALWAEDKLCMDSLVSWKSPVDDILRNMARWSLFVTQLKGAYPRLRIDGIMFGEQIMASIRVVPRL